jgi:hypothetical protein
MMFALLYDYGYLDINGPGRLPPRSNELALESQSAWVRGSVAPSLKPQTNLGTSQRV